MSLELEQQTLQEQFETIIKTEDKLQIREFLDDQNISDVAELVYEFPEYDSQIIAGMSVNRAASVFKILDLPTQKTIIRELPPNTTASLLNELPADDRTDFLEELPSNVVRELIKLLDPNERKVTLSLLGYPENSIGRLMTPDYVYIYPWNTIEEVFSTIRKYGKDSETINVIYVINEKGELLDDIRIRDFILNPPDKKVADMMDDRFIALHPEDDQEMASEVFKMNNRVALPVVSKSNKLLGIITIDDILWVAGEEFSEDMQKMGGTAALDEPYLDVPLFKLYKKRIIWLIILFVGETLTIAAMSGFQKTLEQVLVLSTFIPLIISSGGNSGSQAATLIIQAMALGEITVLDWWRIAKREIKSGFFMGITLGILGFFIVFGGYHFFGLFGEHFIRIGFAIGIAIIGVVLWGTMMGSMLPLLLKKLGADPATSSTPFIATLVDVTGLLIYFGTAFLLLKGVLL
ncbi:MAG: magnesium transporter [Chitinophagaceae bacterium]|jgi:magnesium transporter|nr:magnesium transporter [Chitinophagaceae bacterium]MBK7679126.1 magnesium transporter [Chitinophagaceae bacterium]MBK8299529.1 magnesium transporter [Chitinophagaceae bacterium]MBK9463579.1 magnesium transporter [Chitinophagaceae bacterium]MBK9659300.1 magnesium transporter [Chitinophagaceae bacterium]